jgi:hypothetical protein
MAAPLSVMAQSASEFETGGIQLSFGVTFGVDTNDNRALDPVDKIRATEIYTDLTLGLLTETRNQRLSFDLGGRLRNLDTDIRFATDNGFVEPSAALAYTTSNRSTRFAFSAALDESDLSDPDIQRIDGILEILGDATLVRRATSAETSLDWGDDRRFGFGVFASYLETKYRGGTPLDTGGLRINNSQVVTGGLRARLDLSETTTWNTSLSVQSFEEDTIPGTRDTVSLSNTLSIDRARGPLTLGLTVTDTEEGQRVATSVGRVLELPRGTLSGTIGSTRAATGGDTFLTGSLDYTHELPRGRLNLGLGRSVSSSELDDAENLRTQLSLRYRQDLTPVSAFSLLANWAEIEETATGLTSSAATLGASFSYEVTPDWDLNLGLRHRIRDNDVDGKGSSNTVFFEISRTFVTRF